MTLQLKPEQERDVDEKAMDAEPWSREMHALVESHSTNTPLLSDEAIDCDAFYGPRGM